MSEIPGRLYGFDYLGNRTHEREYGTAAQAAAQGNDWTRSRVAGFNSDGGLVRYAVYDKNNDNSLDTSLYAYGRDALGKKNFGAHGRIASTGDTSWTISRRYTWDGDWVVADSTEVGRRYYAYMGHRRIAEVAEDISGKWTSRAVLTDHLGTVTGIVGDSGNVEAAYLLDPYGNLEHYAGKYQTLLLYTGKEWVSELAGYEFGARVYDPVMGMWWGRDKAAQFWSPWASTGMGLNQMNGVDPNGREFTGDNLIIYQIAYENKFWGSPSLETHMMEMHRDKNKYEGVFAKWKGSGQRGRDVDGNPIIYINNGLSPYRQATTLVHEVLEPQVNVESLASWHRDRSSFVGDQSALYGYKGFLDANASGDFGDVDILFKLELQFFNESAIARSTSAIADKISSTKATSSTK